MLGNYSELHALPALVGAHRIRICFSTGSGTDSGTWCCTIMRVELNADAANALTYDAELGARQQSIFTYRPIYTQTHTYTNMSPHTYYRFVSE